MADIVNDFDSAGLLRRVFQGMSNQIAGRTATDLVPGEEYLPTTTADPATPDEPDAPMDPAALAEEVHQHPADVAGARPSSSSYAWGDFQNGRIPTKNLKAIGQGSHRLETGAADAWVAMRAAAAADGVTLKLTDSYRTYDAQVSVRQRKGHKVATAKPGTSVHGWGRAVDADVNDPATLAWLQQNAAEFGWRNPAWAQKKGKSFEPWHWEFNGGAH